MSIGFGKIKPLPDPSGEGYLLGYCWGELGQSWDSVGILLGFLEPVIVRFQSERMLGGSVQGF